MSTTAHPSLQTPTAKTSEELYAEISDDHKTLLQMKAVVYEVRSDKEYASILRHCKVYKQGGRQYLESDISGGFSFLRDAGFFPDGEEIGEHMVHTVMKQAVLSPKMHDVINHLRKEDVSYYTWNERRNLRKKRNARFALYSNDDFSIKGSEEELICFWDDVFAGIPEDLPWAQSRIISHKHLLMSFYVRRGIGVFTSCHDVVEAINDDADLKDINYLVAEYYLSRGDLDALEKKIADLKNTAQARMLSASLAFLRNDLEASFDLYNAALEQRKKKGKRKQWFFDDVHAVFYIMILLSRGDYDCAVQARQCLNNVLYRNYTPYQNTLFALEKLINYFGFGEEVSEFALMSRFPLDALFSLLIAAMIGADQVGDFVSDVAFYFEKAKREGYRLSAAICAEILVRYEENNSVYKDYIEAQGFVSFMHLIKATSEWERMVSRLGFIYKKHEKEQETSKELLLVWQVNPEAREVAAIEKKQIKKGWSKGRTVSLRVLVESYREMHHLSEQDRLVCQALEKDGFLGYHYSRRYFDGLSVGFLKALIDHPHVYHTVTGQPIKIEQGSPQLMVFSEEDHYRIRLSVDAEVPGSHVIEEEPGRYHVVDVTQKHVDIYRALSPEGVLVPQEGKESLLSAVRQMTELLDVSLPITVKDIPSRQGDVTLIVRLAPEGEGINLSLFMRPFGTFGPCVKPGVGSPVLITRHEEKPSQAVRDLQKENAVLEQFVAACPVLAKESTDDSYSFSSPQECLQLLSEVKSYQADHEDEVSMEWPHGASYAVKRTVGFDHFNLRIRQDNDWFSIEGELEIAPGKVMKMRELLSSLESSKGNFIRLQDNEFLGLSEHFRKSLERIKALTEQDDLGVRLHKLRALSINEVMGEFSNVSADAAWQEQKEQIKKMRKAIKPVLPKEISAELRDYQMEGFNWLSRLAHWNLGACLADDMGLGKTLQAIAVIAKYAKKGPSLVVAPTSVCFNWIAEIKKHAPVLNCHLFAESDRNKIVDTLKGFDVLICSYGLLSTAIDQFEERQWRVLVLDEAQAIKNSSTKRAKAVYRLKGDFRLALTGTPVENHLGELWSLFQFLNPGLLGSEEAFFKEFVVPIEQRKDASASDALKLMVQPFILRRKKSAVLKELPAKTEQVIVVEPSEKEVAFYEALRQKALDNINNTQGDPQGQRHMKLLAEITKLRQACCHPSLTCPEASIESSKLKQLERLLRDLLENNHRVLIFSQFVRYLNIVKDLLIKQKIAYQYLDGQTPGKQRKKHIAAFQAGEGDVFLLSLKAGGVGVNLTAANYVILLDPWWNPAVEDQAADRAHRIGQTNPVTIYRLIVKNTIEERILALHQQKRDLANDLLESSYASGKLSEKELLALIVK